MKGKGQSLIIEFILFFSISFSLFATISFLFYNQSQLLSEQTGSSLSTVVNDMVSLSVLKALSCKACINITVEEEIPSKIGGFFYETRLQQIGINTTLFANRLISEITNPLNLNETFTLSGSVKSENKIVEIIINNMTKTIGVS